MSEISRRSVARGATWAIPTVAVAASAPAMAASPVPAISSSTFFGNANVSGTTVNPYSCNGREQLQVDGVRSPSFFTLTGLSKGASVTGISTTFWLPVDAGTTWSRVSGSSSYWSIPTSAGSTTRNGVTYYGYTTTFSGPISVTGTSYTIPSSQMFNFVSSCQSGSDLASSTYHYTQSAKVNGTAVKDKDNGWSNVMTG